MTISSYPSSTNTAAFQRVSIPTYVFLTKLLSRIEYSRPPPAARPSAPEGAARLPKQLPPRFSRPCPHASPSIPVYRHPDSSQVFPRPCSSIRFCATFLLLPCPAARRMHDPNTTIVTMPAYPLTVIPHPAPSRAHGRCGPVAVYFFAYHFGLFSNA